MAKRNGNGKKRRGEELENVCSYCLFFQPRFPGRRPLSGNCAYHKEWIENASRTTCTDMSNRPLKEKGIYTLVSSNSSGWLYIRREKKIRTRLFLVKRGER